MWHWQTRSFSRSKLQYKLTKSHYFFISPQRKSDRQCEIFNVEYLKYIWFVYTRCQSCVGFQENTVIDIWTKLKLWTSTYILIIGRWIDSVSLYIFFHRNKFVNKNKQYMCTWHWNTKYYTYTYKLLKQ